MQVNVTKIALYVVLAVLSIYFSRQFVARYSVLMSTEVDSDPYALAVAPGNPPEPVDLPATNLIDVTVTNEVPGEVETGSPVVSEVPATAETNAITAGAPPSDERPAAEEMLTKGAMERGTAPDVSGIGLYAVALFGVLIGLGILAAHDISTFLAQRAHKLLHNEEGEGVHDADYDHAEKVWADGDFLEAVRLMREYLGKHPREVHVMVRIAEIYEKDLGNFLAAALEYEELLKQKLPAERWGWAAIHLVNLYYGKLDRPKDGLALLWRIHREYGNTQAAAKARKRLAQIDPDFAIEEARLERESAEREAASDPGGEDEEEEGGPMEPAWQPPKDDPGSNLPRGFRPKKH